MLDEQTADGQDARISKTSVAGSWGAVAGTLRYFADRFGVARASIEGTTLPYDLIRKYAVPGPAAVVLTRHKQRQELALSQPLHYFGFDLERGMERAARRNSGSITATPHATLLADGTARRRRRPPIAAADFRPRGANRSTNTGDGRAARSPASTGEAFAR